MSTVEAPTGIVCRESVGFVCLVCAGLALHNSANSYGAQGEHEKTEQLRAEAGQEPLAIEFRGPKPSTRATVCSRCSQPLDKLTPGCITCERRHRMRAWYSRKYDDFAEYLRVKELA
jgi:hypothetical protein